MFKRSFWSIFIASLLIVLLPYIANALSYEQVSQIAQETTVLIDGCSSGSGVLYKKEGDIYSVLTAKHVVEDTKLSCLVITPDKFRYKIEPNQIIFPQEKIDLAVVQFQSNKSYKLADFGNSQEVKIGTKVYVSGSPQPSESIPQRTLLVTNGNVVGIQPSQNGYEWIYSSPTRSGMSGGPVFNKMGKVIGINGQSDRAGDQLNLGIPIQTFLSVKVSPSPSVSPKKVEVKPSLNETQNQESAKTKTPNNWLYIVILFIIIFLLITGFLLLLPNHKNADYYNNRGNVYKNQQKYELALSDYNKAIELNPNYANAYSGRGGVYETLKQYQKALEDYEKSAQLYGQEGAESYYQIILKNIEKVKEKMR